MKEEKPLVKKGHNSFEWRFDNKIKNKKKYINLRNAFRKISSDTGNWHKEKIDDWG